jgi:hypothetical protein
MENIPNYGVEEFAKYLVWSKKKLDVGFDPYKAPVSTQNKHESGNL